MQTPRAPLPSQETERLQAVHRLNILDTAADPRLDALTLEATKKLHMPVSTVSILDKNREWHKSCTGLDIKEAPREIAFCSWALLSKDVFIVEDTLKDDRFKNNPYVQGPPYIRFYAGFALYDAMTRFPIGVFCVKDTKPRSLSVDEIGILFELSQKAAVIISGGSAHPHQYEEGSV